MKRVLVEKKIPKKGKLERVGLEAQARAPRPTIFFLFKRCGRQVVHPYFSLKKNRQTTCRVVCQSRFQTPL